MVIRAACRSLTLDHGSQKSEVSASDLRNPVVRSRRLSSVVCRLFSDFRLPNRCSVHRVARIDDFEVMR